MKLPVKRRQSAEICRARFRRRDRDKRPTSPQGDVDGRALRGDRAGIEAVILASTGNKSQKSDSRMSVPICIESSTCNRLLKSGFQMKQVHPDSKVKCRFVAVIVWAHRHGATTFLRDPSTKFTTKASAAKGSNAPAKRRRQECRPQILALLSSSTG